MDQAFTVIWKVLRADDPFRDYRQDGELCLAIGQKLMDLVADGVTDPVRLRKLTVENLRFRQLATHFPSESDRFRDKRRLPPLPTPAGWAQRLQYCVGEIDVCVQAYKHGDRRGIKDHRQRQLGWCRSSQRTN